MTVGLSHGMPGLGSGICLGPISGSTMHNAGSTTSPSGGGVRTATHSWMICGEHMEPVTCPFCSPPADVIVAKNRFCYARWDRYPVSKGHMLVIPFRHVEDFFDLAGEEKYAILELLGDCKQVIEKTEKPAGYNIGFNVGAAAGQTVMHCHCHVIPRYRGDTDNPRGGVRGVIPRKREY
jgi:diadenosine tetraphosphate (Ap4A) HIT family hydrolase